MSYYGSRFSGSGLNMFPPVIAWLLGINIFIFLLDRLILPGLDILTVHTPIGPISYLTLHGALWPFGSETNLFGVWQYFTYMFLHGDFLHIFFNMLMLWMFGVELEQMWGSKRFLAFYLICGLGAGIVQSIVTMVANDGAWTVGASGAITGVMVAFGFTFPDRMVFVMYFLPLRAKFAVLLMIGVNIYFGITGTGGNVAYFAHLGGALIGYLLLKFGSNNVPLPGFFKDGAAVGAGGGQGMFTFNRTPRRTQDPRIIDVRFRDRETQKAEPRQRVPAMNFGDDQARIDAILDKISVSGYQNLTEEEKAILQEASKKMR